MIKYAFDIEVFKNLFTATFVNVEDEKDIHVFVIGFDRNDQGKLIEFLNQEIVLIGYNNISYDNPILRYIIDYDGEKLTTDVYNLSSKLIDENFRRDKQIMNLRYPRDRIYAWNSIDLMAILAFDKLKISLKQTAINLKWHKIQDIPFNPSGSVSQDKLEMILDYNMNDVLITKRLYEELEPVRQLRTDLSRLYNINLMSASDSKMANMILENIYSNELKMDIRSIRTMRTPREKVLLGNCIANFVKFESPQLQELYERLSGMYVYKYNDFRYQEKVYYANNIFSLGVGGLHTEDTAGKFETTDTHIIMDMDVASYYPNLIINNEFYPEHLGPRFIKVLKKITAERLDAKKKKDWVKADGLKITINSIFGKMGSEFFWLYDPKQFLSTTISGQLGLLMLVEGMFKNNIEVISCNTDGVVCKIPVEKLDKYYEVAHAWEKVTGLELEFTKYKKYVRRDVNSYITVKENGTTKEKGAFVKEIDLKKAYHMPIVGKALHAYFVEGVPIRKTLDNCKDIMEFCISQKSGENFTIELHYGNKIEKQQKTNRFYITTKGGALLKRQIFSNSLTGIHVGRMVRILNDYDKDVPFDEYNVDLSFYEKEAMKIVDEIEPKQMSLFQMSFQDVGKKTKMNLSANAETAKEKQVTSTELNKMGKNQLIKRIESIVENGEKVEGISPRYVYVDAFDAKSMLAILYCLNKGIRQAIHVDKAAYKKNKIEMGQILFCDKFDKRENGYAVTEYKIKEKLEEIAEKLI